jgi:hypothetical protein
LLEALFDGKLEAVGDVRGAGAGFWALIAIIVEPNLTGDIIDGCEATTECPFNKERIDATNR